MSWRLLLEIVVLEMFFTVEADYTEHCKNNILKDCIRVLQV